MGGRPYYMVRIVSFFVGGILLFISYPNLISKNVLLLTLPALVIGFFLIVMVVKNKSLKNLLLGLVGLSSIFLTGYFNATYNRESSSILHVSNVENEIIFQKVRLISSPEEKRASWKITGKIESVYTEGRWRLATGKVNYYWKKSEPVNSLRYNDILLIKGAPQNVEPPRNPKEFDWKKYLSYRNIYNIQFIRSGSWQLISNANQWSFKDFASRIRVWATRTIRKYITTPNEQDIILALVLGVKDGVDDELLKAYSSSGSIHVLAVSGLHVGILYLIIGFFLKPIQKLKVGKWIAMVITLIILWSYALITNFSPSVLRAVTMFSFFVVSKPFGKGVNIFNTIAGSAFFILLWDPFLILSVGFQLSYSAVLGIILLQRSIYNLYVPKNFIINHLWVISSVSISAQIATFPLCIYYFHQFPVYFLLSNLVVIDIAFLILNGGLILIFLNFSEVLSYYLGQILTSLVQFLNHFIFSIAKLPFSVIDGIQISIIQCLALFAIIVSCRALFIYKKFRYIFLVLAGVVVFSLQSWSHFFNVINKSGVVVYNIKGHGAIEWFDKGKSYLLYDTALNNKPQTVDFHIRPFMSFRQTSNVEVGSENIYDNTKGLQFRYWKGKSFLWINNKSFQSPNLVNVDYLIVGRNAISSIRKVNNNIQFKNLILDSSNSNFYCEKIQNEAKKLGKNCFSVLNQGAYVELL